MLEKQWKTMEGIKIDSIIDTMKSIFSEGDREIHVGSDSQQIGKWTEMVTVIVMLNKGKGGRAFYIRERLVRIKSLRERLMREVWMSVNVGLELNAHIPETVGLTVHVDANPNLKFRSSDYVKELASMVVSQGFKTLLKPNAWCASHAADHVVKNKVIGSSRQ